MHNIHCRFENFWIFITLYKQEDGLCPPSPNGCLVSLAEGNEAVVDLILRGEYIH